MANHLPCNFDHNGECILCDCWPSQCAYQRYLVHDYTYETMDQLEDMFRNVPIYAHPVIWRQDLHMRRCSSIIIRMRKAAAGRLLQ